MSALSNHVVVMGSWKPPVCVTVVAMMELRAVFMATFPIVLLIIAA